MIMALTAMSRTRKTRTASEPEHEPVIPPGTAAEHDRLVLLVAHLAERREPLAAERDELHGASEQARATGDVDAGLAAAARLRAVDADLQVIDGHTEDAAGRLAEVKALIDRLSRTAALPARHAQVVAAVTEYRAVAPETVAAVIEGVRAAQDRARQLVADAVTAAAAKVAKCDRLRDSANESAAAVTRDAAELGVDVAPLPGVPDLLNAPELDDHASRYLLNGVVRSARDLLRGQAFPDPIVPLVKR